MPIDPHRSPSTSKKYEKNEGKIDNNSSQLKRTEKSGEILNINKPKANKANAFLVESFILCFTF
jgi:hypothetical protein